VLRLHAAGAADSVASHGGALLRPTCAHISTRVDREAPFAVLAARR